MRSNQQRITISAIGLLIGIVAGVLLGFPSNSQPASSTDDLENKKLTALEKNESRPLAEELAALTPANLHGVGGGSIEAWSRIAELDLTELTRLARHLDGRDWISNADIRVLELVMERWRQLDPLGALDWIETSSQSTIARSSHGRIFAALARRDLETALERLETIPENLQRFARFNLTVPFAEQDPLRAAQFYLDSKGKENEDWMHAQIARVWTKSDPLAAIAFYEASELKITGEIVGNWANHDSEAALSWVQTQDLDPMTKIAYVKSIAGQLMARDPIAGMATLESIPAGTGRNSAMIDLLSSWADRDSAAAITWARDLEDPAALARAMGQISTTIRRTEPALALELADSLPDAEFRKAAFDYYADVKAGEDPEGAIDWAEGIEDEDRRRTAITSSVASLATKDLTRAVNYFVATEDQTHKKEMLTKIIKADDLGRSQLKEAREVVESLSKEDQRMAIDTILEVNGKYYPKPLKAVLKLTGKLGPFLDWAEKIDGNSAQPLGD